MDYTVSDNYLHDITGKAPAPDLNGLLDGGLLNLLPDKIKDYKLDLDKKTLEAIHSYTCHVEKLSANKDCDTAKGIRANEKDRYIGYIDISNDATYQMYLIGGKVEFGIRKNKSSINLPKNKFLSGTFRTGNLSEALSSQVKTKDRNKIKDTFRLQKVKDDRNKDEANRQKWLAAVNGIEKKGNGQSIGDRAIFFNNDGSVTTTADTLRDKSLATQLSANIAGETINNGTIPKDFKVSKDIEKKSTKKHPNKKKVGATNDILGGIAALGGVAALMGVIAALLPLSMVLSVITFFTSITTMITNVTNMLDTFLTVTDGLLKLLGQKSSTAGIKKFVADAVDNVFGKENVAAAKAEFGKGVTAIKTGVKLAESAVAGRNATDTAIEGLAFQVGTVNNALGTAGLIPPELMATSAGIDALVAKQDDDFKDELKSLTSELQSSDKAEAEIKAETEAIRKVQAAKIKEIDNLKVLIDPVRSDVGKIKVDEL